MNVKFNLIDRDMENMAFVCHQPFLLGDSLFLNNHQVGVLVALPPLQTQEDPLLPGRGDLDTNFYYVNITFLMFLVL